MNNFLNFYTKYPWAAIIIVIHWFAAALTIIYSEVIDATTVMTTTFIATLIYAYIGFKLPKE